MSAETDYLYEKTVTCLVCEKAFITKKVLSKYIRAHKHDTDFCSYYVSSERNPLLYYVQVCPNCGFSSSKEFSSYFPPSTKETIKKRLCLNWSGGNYSAKRSLDEGINSYKLAIFCGTLKKEKHIALAGLYLRLAWLYRTEKVNTDEELRFTRLAVNEYVESYITGDYTDANFSEIRLLYIIGELSRRLGLREQATRYFSRVIEKQKDAVEKGIVEMAKNRWAEMREQPQNVK